MATLSKEHDNLTDKEVLVSEKDRYKQKFKDLKVHHIQTIKSLHEALLNGVEIEQAFKSCMDNEMKLKLARNEETKQRNAERKVKLQALFDADVKRFCAEQRIKTKAISIALLKKYPPIVRSAPSTTNDKQGISKTTLKPINGQKDFVNWIKCSKPRCGKWRTTIDPDVDGECFPDDWECQMNSWDPQHNSCDKPEEQYETYHETEPTPELTQLQKFQNVIDKINANPDFYGIDKIDVENSGGPSTPLSTGKLRSDRGKKNKKLQVVVNVPQGGPTKKGKERGARSTGRGSTSSSSNVSASNSDISIEESTGPTIRRSKRNINKNSIVDEEEVAEITSSTRYITNTATGAKSRNSKPTSSSRSTRKSVIKSCGKAKSKASTRPIRITLTSSSVLDTITAANPTTTTRTRSSQRIESYNTAEQNTRLRGAATTATATTTSTSTYMKANTTTKATSTTETTLISPALPRRSSRNKKRARDETSNGSSINEIVVDVNQRSKKRKHN